MRVLKKGEKVLIDNKVDRLCVEITWDSPNDYDIDGSAFLISDNGKVKNDDDIIFYNNNHSYDKSISRVDMSSNNKEKFLVNINKISNGIEKISFVLTIHDGSILKQTFKKVSNISFKIIDDIKGTNLFIFPIHSLTDETAIIVFELYRYKNDWKLNTIGSGFFGGLADICKEYGLDVKDEEVSNESEYKNYIPNNYIEQIMYENMVNRISNFQIDINNESMNKAQELIKYHYQNILENDHYLERSINYMEYKISNLNNHNNIYMSFGYHTTKEQEILVDSKIRDIVNKVPVNLSKVEKVKFVHDFIIDTVTYDESLIECTAYAGLIKGKTICQGYAQLAYRLLNEIGIEALIVLGEAKTKQTGIYGGHAWNLVSVDGNWYHLDCTWDDPIGSNRIHYDYFLIDDYKIRNTHSWDYSKYPSALKLYNY